MAAAAHTAPRGRQTNPATFGAGGGGHVGDDGRSAELVTQRVAEARVDRAVLPGARRPRRPAGDELADGVEVGLQQLVAGGQRRRGPRWQRREQLDLGRDRGAIYEVGHLGCRKPGGPDGSGAGAAWGRGRRMVVQNADFTTIASLRIAADLGCRSYGVAAVARCRLGQTPSRAVAPQPRTWRTAATPMRATQLSKHLAQLLRAARTGRVDGPTRTEAYQWVALMLPEVRRR